MSADLQGQLNGASLEYGGRASGEELWLLGPEGIDVIVFRLMFLMAEAGDNWDSEDILGLNHVYGEQFNGDPGDPAYLTQMRDALFPNLTTYTTSLIDYFFRVVGIEPISNLVAANDGPAAPGATVHLTATVTRRDRRDLHLGAGRRRGRGRRDGGARLSLHRPRTRPWSPPPTASARPRPPPGS